MQRPDVFGEVVFIRFKKDGFQPSFLFALGGKILSEVLRWLISGIYFINVSRGTFRQRAGGINLIWRRSVKIGGQYRVGKTVKGILCRKQNRKINSAYFSETSH